MAAPISKNFIRWSKEEEQQFLTAYKILRKKGMNQKDAIAAAIIELPADRQRPANQSRLRKLVGPTRPRRIKQREAKTQSFPLDMIPVFPPQPEPKPRKVAVKRARPTAVVEDNDKYALARELIAMARALLGV